MINKHDFAYSVALIRTLETLLLNENEVERMMLAKSGKESFKVLNEFDYSDNKAGIEDPSQFQKVINEGLLEIKETLSKATPDNNILNILLHQYDFHNIKTLLKAKLSNKSFDEVESLLNEMGAINIEALQNFIFEGTLNPWGLDEDIELEIKKSIKEAQLLFEKEGNNPQVLDLFLDEKLMEIIHSIALKSGSTFLMTYVKKLIDLSNIRLFFRMKAQDKELDLYEIGFIKNGKIPFSKFADAYKQSLADFVETMKPTDFSQIVENGYKHYKDEKTFIYLEKEIEDHLTNYIQYAKLTPFGPEPLVAFFLAKKNNALIIRMIMVNKLADMEPEEIQKRLRKLYA